MNGYHVSRLWLSAIGLLDHFVLQAGSGGHDTRFLAVFFKELLASSSRLFAHLGQALFSALLQGCKGFDQFFVLDFLFFLADSIFDALSNCF
ncbi:hypothetical protein D3C79_981150 [compost metagenome]